MKRIVVNAAAVLIVALLFGASTATVSAQQTDVKALIDDLVAANRILYRQGVVDGFGHVSARHPTRPDRFLMSMAKAPGRVNAEDIMDFDLDGNAVDARGRPIYQERFIHSEAYKARADVNAVI